MKRNKRREIADEVRRFTRPPALKDNEITIAQHARLTNCDYDVAARELETTFKAGLLDRRKVLHDGKRRWAYRPKPGSTLAEALAQTQKPADSPPSGESA